jgi:hypothetical protein
MRKGFRNTLVLPLAFVAMGVLALLVPLPHGGRECCALGDLMHVPLFALFAVAIHAALERIEKLAWSHRAMLTVGLLIGLGCATEIAQYFVGRSPSLGDVARDALGAVAGTAWAMRRPVGSRRGRTGLATLAVITLLIATAVPALELTDTALQWVEKPRIGSFEQPLEISRWQTWDCRIRRTRGHATDGSWSLRVDLLPGAYPGIGTPWPPRDWSGHEQFEFDVALDAGPPLDLVVKVEEADREVLSEERYEQVFHLLPGRRHIEISLAAIAAAPRGRELDLRQIGFLQLFTVDLDRPRTLFLDNVRLR